VYIKIFAEGCYGEQQELATASSVGKCRSSKTGVIVEARLVRALNTCLLYLGADGLLHGITCKSMEEISGTDNGDALIDFNSTQMLITGNNEICPSLSGTGQDVIISGIVFDDVGNDFRCDYLCHSRKAFCPSFDLILRPLEFLPEDVGELGYDSRGYEESVGPLEGMFPNGSHFSVREIEGRSIDIRIDLRISN
jgi:hypothetical protein